MYCQLSFTEGAFGRLLKYRIAEMFQPPTVSAPFPDNIDSWLDGIIVTGVQFSQLANDRPVLVNIPLNTDLVVPNPAVVTVSAAAVAADFAADLFFVRAQDVRTAGLGQPPPHVRSIPHGFIRVLVRAEADVFGRAVLYLELDTSLLGGLGLPPQVEGAIKKATSKRLVLDIAEQLKDILPGGNSRVLNAGVTRGGNGAVTLRFEFADSEAAQIVDKRAAEWQSFYSPGFQANLANGDWSADLDGDAVAKGLADAVNTKIKNESSLQFTTNTRYSYSGDEIPNIAMHKDGVVVAACGGYPLHFTVNMHVDFRVPSDNLLRTSFGLDVSQSAADLARCFLTLTFDPSAAVITAADHGQLGAGLAVMGASFVFPIKGLAVLSVLSLVAAGFDNTLVQGVVADRLSEVPKVIPLGDGAYAYEQSVVSRNDFTKDWMVLKRCTGSGNRLLLSGALNVPDAVLPRLTAKDLEGFSNFVLRDRCEPGKGQESNGSVTLSLRPGYGANLSSVQPVRVPTISVKYGLQPNGSQIAFQVVDDKLGVYHDPATEYTQVYIPGVPCIAEVKLTNSTLRKAAYKDFRDNPYDLRVRVFTNGGVREYLFKAPPKFQEFVESPEQTLQRISRCKALSSSLVLRKYLEKIWLGRPPETGAQGSQHWEVQVRGLDAGRRVTVWNQDSGAELVRAFADHRGNLNISLVLGSGEQARSILMGLDDQPFPKGGRLTQIEAIEIPPDHAPVVRMAIRQTVLTAIDHIDFDEPVESLNLTDNESGSLLMVRTSSGKQLAYRLAAVHVGGQAVAVPVTGEDAGEAAAVDGLVAWRGNLRRFLLLSRRPGRTEVLGEYSARSSYDLAGERSDLFAQVSEDGRRVVLFRKSVPLQFGTMEWDEPAYRG